MGKKRLSLVEAQRSKVSPDGSVRTYSNALDQAKAEAAAPDAEPTVRLNVNVPESMYRQFKSMAVDEGRSMTWYILRWIEHHVSTSKYISTDE